MVCQVNSLWRAFIPILVVELAGIIQNNFGARELIQYFIYFGLVHGKLVFKEVRGTKLHVQIRTFSYFQNLRQLEKVRSAKYEQMYHTFVKT